MSLSSSMLTRSNADESKTSSSLDGNLRNIDARIAWFSQRLASLRMERIMCQMSLGAMRVQADPGYLENIYVGHLCKLHEERALHAATVTTMDTK